MKIVLVTETYPPEVNGVAMTLHRLSAGLVARGHRVEVVRPRQPGERAAVAVSGDGEIRQILVAGISIPFYRSLQFGLPAAGLLRRRWAEERPDVVHIATEGPLGLAALLTARKLGIPTASSFHTNFHQYGGHYGMDLGHDAALRYLRWFHNRTSCTLVPTDQIRDELAAAGFRGLDVLSRGVDAELFAPSRRDLRLRKLWGAEEEDPVAIYVGRLAAEKNLELAVRAFLAAKKRAPRARFILVGDGPQRAPLARKYPEFVYAGVQRGEELARHYASADLFLFPSVTETFGNVVTEAMASGLVVLSYDYAAGRQHLRHSQSGYLVPFGDAAGFEQAAEAAVARRADWPRLRTAAREVSVSISWDAIVARFEGQLESVVTQFSCLAREPVRG